MSNKKAKSETKFQRVMSKPREIISDINANGANTDPNGSYTGTPTGSAKYETPIQDADDL
jgi:hypothetical protein